MTRPGSDGIERRLAAILSADAVGYGRLMAEDEVATLRTLEAYREEMAALVRQHGGRVVDSPGDNLLAEFASATEAVDCAVELQRVFEARNRARPAERRMAFRMGVHLGEVMAEGECIYGDGVNIAARLERLAEPGGVCISGAVHEQVESKLDLGFQDLGEQLLKNIPKPVRTFRVGSGSEAGAAKGEPRAGRRVLLAAGVLLILVLGGLQVWRLERARSGAVEAAAPEAQLSDEEPTVPGFSGAPAIAVLAFDNLSGDPEQEYFADGIAEDLITRLSGWSSFPVIARNSSFVYKGQAVDVKQVSRELGARYLVEGSVRRAEDRVRIGVQVIDATTGHHVWAETYDRELQDVFTLQDEITESIVASMFPKLFRSEWKRAARHDTQHFGAYDLAMQGWWHFSRSTAEHNAKARSLFDQVIELEPSNARSYAGLALTHYNDLLYQWTPSPAWSIVELERTARRGATLDSELAIGQLALAFAHQITGRRQEMIAAVERAIELRPSFALAHAMLGLYLGETGRPDEALPHLEKAMRLSPRDPMTWLFSYGVAVSHFGGQRYDDAVSWAQRSLQQKPDYVFTWGVLAASQAQLGHTEEARTAFEEMLRQQPELSEAALGRFFPHADTDWFEHFIDGLRQAGLPEE